MKVLSYEKLKLLMSNVTSKFATFKDLDYKLNKTESAASARRLTFTSQFITNLSKEYMDRSAYFDGTQDATMGVTGTLNVANGGTGSSNTIMARGNIGAMGSFLVQQEEPHPSLQNVGDLWFQEEK